MQNSDRSNPISWHRRHLTLVTAAALTLFGTAHAATITWRGTTDGAWNTTTANWAGGSTTFTAGDTVTFDDTATGTTGITTAAAVSPAGTVTVNNATKDYSFSGVGGLSGTLNLSKLGAGALTLSNSNTFTGTLTLRGGTTTLSGNALVTATTGSASGRSFNVGTTAGDAATLVLKDNAAFTTSIVYLGDAAGAAGTVLMQGGTFTSTPNGNGSAFFRIGSSGTGIWNQTGGLALIANSLPTIARNAGSVGQVTVSGGTFQLTGNGSGDYLQLASTGTGTLTISGNGVVETGTGSSGGLWFNVVNGAGQTAGAGTLNLDGGTLRTRRVLSSGSVAATSTFNFNGGTLVALTGNSTFMQGLTAANVKSGGALINTNGFNITIAQNLLDGTGGGGLTKSGTGTLTLSGSNTYTGATTISAGVLSANNANALGNGGNITLTGGTLQYTATSAGQDWSTRFKNSTSAIALDTNGQNVTLAGVIDSSNTGGLIKIGSGTLTITAANTMTGTTQFNGGSVAFSGGLSPSYFSIGESAADSGVMMMTGGTLSPSGLFRVGSNGSGTLNQSGGLITFTAAQQLPSIGRLANSVGVLAVSSGTFRLTGNPASAQALQVGASGTGTLNISGNGVVDTGTASVGNGLLIVGQNAGTGAGTVNLDGGTLRTGRIATTGSAAATSTFNFNGGTIVALASNATFMQGLTNAYVKSGGAVIDTSGKDITIAQNLLDGTGGGGLTKTGSGTLTISGSNTYTGTTTISGGMLAANNANALGAAGSITLAGGTLQYTAASAGQDWASRFKGSTSAISLDTNGQNVTLAGSIDSTNTAGLTKLGAGTLALTGTSGYRGDTTVSAGTLLLSGNGAVTTGTAGMLYVGRNAGDSGSIVVQGGASLSVGQVFVGNAAASSGTVTITGGTLLAANDGSFLCRIGASGSATWNQSGGLVTMQDLQPTLGRLTGGRGEMTVSSGTFMVTGTSANALMNVGSQGVGVLTISGNGVVETGTGLSGVLNVVNGVAGNTTGSGLVNLDGGTLRTRAIATGGTGSAVSTFNFNGGALVALASSPEFMQGLTAANVKGGGAVIDTNGSDITIAQALLDGGGGGGLTKNGAGALTLAGLNTYTGATVVNSGSLVANGSLAGGVSVAAGGVLGGSGSVGAISGAGLVGPGNSPGILTATSVDPSSSMSFAFEFTGAAPNYGSPTGSVNDLLWLTGGTPFTASLTSANAVNLYLTPAAAEAGTLTGGFFTAGQSDFVASIQGAAFSYFVQDPAGTFIYGGQTYKTLLQYDSSKSVTISTVAANGGQVMQMVVVPEPGAVVLAGAGVALAAWMVRRRGS